MLKWRNFAKSGHTGHVIKEGVLWNTKNKNSGKRRFLKIVGAQKLKCLLGMKASSHYDIMLALSKVDETETTAT